MLELYIPGKEMFNDNTQEFLQIPGATLKLEHSLLSISKWESKWKKSFISSKDLSGDELISYIKCMTIGSMPSDAVYESIDYKTAAKIRDYINDPMTATTFSKAQSGPPSREIITSELVYYWMVQHGIPFECEKWHFNRLLTLIRICAIKGSDGKNMSKKDIMRQNAEINAMRRKAMGTKG